MSLKNLGVAMMAVLALGAVFATSAFAGTVNTNKASWTTGTTPNANTIPTGKANGLAIKCRKTAASPNFDLSGTVAGFPVTLTATGVECVNVTIYNEVVSGVPHAKATGKLRFTGVTVDEPKPCHTAANLETNLLEGEVLMVNGSTKPFFKFAPDATAGVVNFITVPLTECAAEGNYPVKGYTYCEATNATEVHSEQQECTDTATSAAQSKLTLGPNAAAISGEITAERTAGGAFGAEEK